MLHVLVYDISRNRHRQRLAKLLLDYGDRVQRSVFEADLTPAEVQEIVQAAKKLLEHGDSFHIYPLCAACSGRVYRSDPPEKRAGSWIQFFWQATTRKLRPPDAAPGRGAADRRRAERAARKKRPR